MIMDGWMFSFPKGCTINCKFLIILIPVSALLTVAKERLDCNKSHLKCHAFMVCVLIYLLNPTNSIILMTPGWMMMKSEEKVKREENVNLLQLILRYKMLLHITSFSRFHAVLHYLCALDFWFSNFFSLLARQPKFESMLSEVDIVINELHYALSNMTCWMQPEPVAKNLVCSPRFCSCLTPTLCGAVAFFFTWKQFRTCETKNFCEKAMWMLFWINLLKLAEYPKTGLFKIT